MLIEIGNKNHRCKTRTGTSRVTKRKILEESYIVTEVYTSASLMRLKFICSFTTGGVTFKITDYRVVEDQSQKLMARVNYNGLVRRKEIMKNPMEMANQIF